MKIYVIIGDNGEIYEDYYEWVEAVYIAKENAQKELKRLRSKAERDHKKDKFFAKRRYRIKEFETKD
jgi:hypothetical protein